MPFVVPRDGDAVSASVTGSGMPACDRRRLALPSDAYGCLALSRGRGRPRRSRWGRMGIASPAACGAVDPDGVGLCPRNRREDERPRPAGKHGRGQ